MPRNGIPDQWTVWFGEEVKRIRESRRLKKGRRLSRDRLARDVNNLLDEDDDLFDLITVEYVKRLETGKIVRVARRIIDLFIQALQCTPYETAKLLLLADRNLLNQHGKTPTIVTTRMNEWFVDIQLQVYEMLITLEDDPNRHLFTAEDIDDMLRDALELVLKARRPS